MQEIHDSLMREGIAKHGGYEIITEGDSFSVAFTSGAAPPPPPRTCTGGKHACPQLSESPRRRHHHGALAKTPPTAKARARPVFARPPLATPQSRRPRRSASTCSTA